MVAARGRIAKDGILVPDEKEANTLYNKGAFGVPQPGGSLVLDHTEALYLVEHDRLLVERHDKAALLELASAAERDFELRYLVYRDLRARSFVVKPSNLSDFNVYPRGSIPGRAASTLLVRCATERGTLDARAVVADEAKARKAGKTLMLAVVDEEGDLTYYDARVEDLKADVPRVPHVRVRATLLADRVLVLDRNEARALFDDGWFGRDIGIGLQLSLPEAAFLAAEGKLDLRDGADGRPVTADALVERAERVEPSFGLRLQVYARLRGRGIVPKTGFKYGTHFRAYVGAPEEEHAPYLVHALPSDRVVPWPEVSGFVRLAHGVRKRLFFAVVAGDDVALLELARRKP